MYELLAELALLRPSLCCNDGESTAHAHCYYCDTIQRIVLIISALIG